MAEPIARPTGVLILALTLVAGSAPAAATVHHHHTIRHASSKAHRPAKPTRRGSHKPAPRHDAAPSGATRVPGGGMKLFCAARSNPLLIRKSTQGAGTTVTVVCR